jgi:hypothetical protein
MLCVLSLLFCYYSYKNHDGGGMSIRHCSQLEKPGVFFVPFMGAES